MGEQTQSGVPAAESGNYHQMALAGVSWQLSAVVAVAVDAAGYYTAGSAAPGGAAVGGVAVGGAAVGGAAVGEAAGIGADIVDIVDIDSARTVHNHIGNSHMLLQHLRNILAVLHIGDICFQG